MIFTRFRSSSWFYARIHLVSNATTSITVSKIYLIVLDFFPFSSFSIPRDQSFLSTLFPPFHVLLLSLFFFLSPSQSFVLSTPTDIEFSSRRINFSFLLSAIPYWLMYPSVSSCSRFLFIVPRTPSIFRLAIGRFYSSSRIRLPSHFSIFHPRGIHGPDNEYSNFETRLGGRWRATRDTKI